MSNEFRELLKKVGSGIHTKKDLTRAEAATAAKMLLKQEATPAQIGAFLISHRIKRPTGLELAGMLDTYDELGSKLTTLTNKKYPLTVLGNPYDGRSRTAPISPITALILVTAGVPVLMHGGEKMPTKFGIPLIEIWQNLGLDFTKLSLNKIQNLLENKGLGFLYLPLHFPEAQSLVKYRDEIGKRPPLATLELIWIPYQGESHLIAGYVHPATEKMMRETFKLRGIKTYTLVKGLEGSCDLKRQQTNIIAINKTDNNDEFEYLKINAQNYGFSSKDVELSDSNILFNQLENVLNGKDSELTSTAIFNGGFYLWRCGICANIEEGFRMSENLLKTQQVKNKLDEIKTFIETIK